MPRISLRHEFLETSIFTTGDGQTVLAYIYEVVNQRKAEGHYEVRYAMLIVTSKTKEWK